MDFITYVQRNMMEQLPALIKSYEGDVSAINISEMEKSVVSLNTVGRYWNNHKNVPN